MSENREFIDELKAAVEREADINVLVADEWLTIVGYEGDIFVVWDEYHNESTISVEDINQYLIEESK